MNNHNIVAVAYIPVLHRGYLDFLLNAREQGATSLFLVGDDILSFHEELDYLNRKDRIRALPVEDMVRVLEDVAGLPIEILSRERASTLSVTHIIMPDEDVSRLVATEYFKNAEVSYVSIFLRWHRDNTAEQKAVEMHRSISVAELDIEMMNRAIDESAQSFDWWRQIGAILVKDGEIIAAAHNTHMPDEQSPNVFGDPRAITKRGVDIHISTGTHAEEIVIGEAARRGIITEDASLYVTEFPCPYCARLIAHSGIKKCYFSKGYYVLDGEEILKASGVELILVDMKKEHR